VRRLRLRWRVSPDEEGGRRRRGLHMRAAA
jgi:hypothetical protein